MGELRVDTSQQKPFNVFCSTHPLIFKYALLATERGFFNSLLDITHYMQRHVHKDTARLYTAASECTHPSTHMFTATRHTVSSHSTLSYRCGCAAGSQACWQTRSPPTRPVCGWWRSSVSMCVCLHTPHNHRLLRHAGSTLYAFTGISMFAFHYVKEKTMRLALHFL